MVTIYSQDGRTTIIGVSDNSTVIDIPGSGVTMISTSWNPIYSRPFVSGLAPAYGPAQHPVGSLDRFTLQRQFRYPVDYIVLRGSAHAHPYTFVHPQAYADGYVGFSAPAEAPIHSGIGAAVHRPLNGRVQPAIAVPARVPAHPSSTSQQNISNAQFHVRFPAPVGTAVQPMSANPRTVLNAHIQASIRATDDTGPNPNSASEQNGTNATQPRSKPPTKVEEKQRKIRWSQLFETDKRGITNSAIRAMPRGILRHGQCNLSGETPGFDLELKFQGRQYVICFQARKAEGNLLRLFEDRIIDMVDADQRAVIREALNNEYSLEYGYWGKTLIRRIRGSATMDPEASFHAFLNGVRQDALVKIV